MRSINASRLQRISRLTVLTGIALMCQSPLGAAVSLYDEASFRPLTGDNKAYRVGDLLTVQVLENSSAQSSAETGTQRKSDVSANLIRPRQLDATVGFNTSGQFDGGGQTQRANKLLATLTVTVREVLPNGDLKVAGEQLLTVNNELQRVNLEGRVRPYDISDANVVMSTRLSDAKITYVGEGDVSERNKRAWYRIILDWLGF
jgi:flagellar L-ring protein precursor FlgH